MTLAKVVVRSPPRDATARSPKLSHVNKEIKSDRAASAPTDRNNSNARCCGPREDVLRKGARSDVTMLTGGGGGGHSRDRERESVAGEGESERSRAYLPKRDAIFAYVKTEPSPDDFPGLVEQHGH